MSVLDGVSNAAPSLTDLREELKRWEKTFAKANGGRKPGRDDIKNDATIGGQE